jgi:hypothetical protein
MMGFGLILTLVFLGAMAYALGWRSPFNQSGPAKTNQTPLESSMPVTRGEISREEYEQMRRDLQR